MNKLEKYSDDLTVSPFKTLLKIGLLLIILLSILGTAVSVIGGGISWFGEAAKVARQELGPQAMLKKYEWFKNAAATLDQKKATISVFQARFENMEETYEGTPRKEWPREDREQYNLWQSELAGITASYNQVASEYNAQMAKINWAFTNVGSLPAGATEALPREFKTYLTQ